MADAARLLDNFYQKVHYRIEKQGFMKFIRFSMLGLLLNFFSCSTPNVASCFDSVRFDHVAAYSKWYAETRKTNRVLVQDFEMEVRELEAREVAQNPEILSEILLKRDGYTIARITKERGVTLTVLNPAQNLVNSVNEAYCQLSKYAAQWTPPH
ncbi:MAG: hypothetical protein MUF71_08680 [Candidatus Kapabacteria bacterium]|jgi:hypothetical protein|nr:hypothetical protein [Candidatus Kapabacteria bacterium]